MSNLLPVMGNRVWGRAGRGTPEALGTQAAGSATAVDQSRSGDICAFFGDPDLLSRVHDTGGASFPSQSQQLSRRDG